MKKERFTATILAGHKDAACEVPFEPERRWGVTPVKLRRGRNGFPVRGTLNKTPFESAIVPRLKKFWLELGHELLDAAGVAVGDEVKVSIEPMTKAKPVSDPLDQLRKICLAFPDTSETISHGAPTFWVRKRTFAMFVNNHHGDGRIAVWCAASLDEQESLVGADPNVFFKPPYVGPSGWLGIRLDRGLDWGVVASLLAESHRMIQAKQTRRSV